MARAQALASAVDLEAAERRLDEERDRIAAIKAAAQPPAECGPEIIAAPARGGFVLQRIRHMEGMTREDFVETPDGYVRRSPIRRGDAFDAMEAAALRRKQACPLTPGQIAIGRRYHDLVELLSADGTKLSQLDGSFGSSDGGDWMDQRLAISRELEGMRRRIGNGVALAVRRIRPSDRGPRARGSILDRVLVDMVCLQGRSLPDVLKGHGWQEDGRNKKALREALCRALDRMIGYRVQKSS
jgi:hypothetical protein